MFTRGHVTNQNHYISTITMLIVTRPSWMVTYRNKPTSSIRMTLQLGSPVRSCDKLNTFYLHLQNTYGHQIRQGADLKLEAPIL